MEKKFIALVTICMVALAGTNGVSAQGKASADIREFQKKITEPKNLITPDNVYKADPEEISPKTLKNFAKVYKDVEDVRWTKNKNGVFAKFILNGIRNTVFYYPNGNWSGSIKSYSEEKLPADIRDIVKSKYYDYSIYLVEELEITESDHIPTYLIYLEDKNNLKVIRIYNWEMEVWKEYKKSKS